MISLSSSCISNGYDLSSDPMVLLFQHKIGDFRVRATQDSHARVSSISLRSGFNSLLHPHTSCITLGKSLSPSVLQFLICKNGEHREDKYKGHEAPSYYSYLREKVLNVIGRTRCDKTTDGCVSFFQRAMVCVRHVSEFKQFRGLEWPVLLTDPRETDGSCPNDEAALLKEQSMQHMRGTGKQEQLRLPVLINLVHSTNLSPISTNKKITGKTSSITAAKAHFWGPECARTGKNKLNEERRMGPVHAPCLGWQ